MCAPSAARSAGARTSAAKPNASASSRMMLGVGGVEKVEVSLAEGKGSVGYDRARAGLGVFKRAVERAGFKAP